MAVVTVVVLATIVPVLLLLVLLVLLPAPVPCSGGGGGGGNGCDLSVRGLIAGGMSGGWPAPAVPGGGGCCSCVTPSLCDIETILAAEDEVTELAVP